MSSNKPRYRLKKEWVIPGSAKAYVLPKDTEFFHGSNNNYICKESPQAIFHFDIIQSAKEWFERIEEPREWEIVRAETLTVNPPIDRITAVKRLSDGVVFKIGDMVKWNYSVDYPSEYHKIERFIIRPNECLRAEANILSFPITNIQHYKEPFQWTDELVLKAHKDWWASLQNNNGTVLKFDCFLKEFKNKNS